MIRRHAQRARHAMFGAAVIDTVNDEQGLGQQY